MQIVLRHGLHFFWSHQRNSHQRCNHMKMWKKKRMKERKILPSLAMAAMRTRFIVAMTAQKCAPLDTNFLVIVTKDLCSRKNYIRNGNSFSFLLLLLVLLTTTGMRSFLFVWPPSLVIPFYFKSQLCFEMFMSRNDKT